MEKWCKRMTLGKKIKHYRIAKNITQKELSKLTGIHIVTIKKYETNCFMPSMNNIDIIAYALDTNMNNLLYPNINLPYAKNGKLYKFLIDAIKNNITTISNNSISFTKESEKYMGTGTFNLNNQEFLSNILNWNNQYSELELLKLNNCDLLHKKGNELSNKEKEIVFNIEEKELRLEAYEMVLIYNR